MMRLTLLSLSLSALVACGGAAPTPVTPDSGSTKPDIGPIPDEMPPERAFLEAEAEADSEEEAYAAAVSELEELVYGDEGWLREGALPVHEPGSDPMYRTDSEGGGEGGLVRVVVGLERERVDALLQELSSQPMPSSVPATLAPSLESAYGLYIEALVCERRRELLDDSSCHAPGEDEIRANLQRVADDIHIRTRFEGGVPLDRNRQPLRPLEVFVERVSGKTTRTPLPALPVSVQQPEGEDALSYAVAVTDEHGLARFSFREGARFSKGLRVSLDLGDPLGPLAELWPDSEMVPLGREVGLRRWAVIAEERVQGSEVGDKVFVQSLDESMQAAGGVARVSLPSAVRGEIEKAGSSALEAMLPAIAERLQGQVDVLVVAELDSEYASRMGAYRVWYEARGRAKVYDMWTGALLAAVEHTVTATGVGDERADREARAKLGQQFAGSLAQVKAVEQP
ncbi:hypothetical protein [Haliangium ochraceum]|nr:hypothetical protein [Haliangium ochraceum]